MFSWFCSNATFTRNSSDKRVGSYNFCGYSDSIVVNQSFVLRIPENLNLARAAPIPVSSFRLLLGNKNLSGWLIGGIAEIQEILDFYGENNITSEVEVIPIQNINYSYERMLKSDVKYRFSIDMKSLWDKA